MCGSIASPVRGADVATEDFTIPSDTPGVTLFVRNKHPRGQTQFAEGKVALFLHGGAYPGEASFDLPLQGTSWMDYIAQRGYDVYFVDLRGYGRSSRPAEMDQPPNLNPPLVRIDVALRDLGSAIDFVKRRRGLQRLILMGWSAGASTVGKYTTAHNDGVVKLVLYAPFWIRRPASAANAAPLPAYRTITATSEKERWLTGLSEEQKALVLPPGWYEQFADAMFASDPVGSKAVPPTVRVPNGATADIRDVLFQGTPLYEPSQLRVPVLIAHADLDVDVPTAMVDAFWQQLNAVPDKRRAEITGGTHRVFMERNRSELFARVQSFLDGA